MLLQWMLLGLSLHRAGNTVILCVQVPGASRIVSMTLNRKGTRLLVNCYDRAVRLYEICHPGRRRRSYTAADLKTRLASAKVCISLCACCCSVAQPGFNRPSWNAEDRQLSTFAGETNNCPACHHLEQMCHRYGLPDASLQNRSCVLHAVQPQCRHAVLSCMQTGSTSTMWVAESC